MRCILAIIITLFMLSGSDAATECDSITNPDQKSECLAGVLNKAYGKDGGIQKRAINPITGNSTFVDLQGNSTFKANLTCPSSTSFIEVMISYLPTNDISFTVNQDTDLNGVSDNSPSYSPVSGICGNGFISCISGTWSNCRGYKWAVATGNTLTFSQVSMGELGGCYCINSSCGALAVSTDKILQDLGSGAAGAIQAAAPNFAVSNVVVSGSKITYYGQDTNCNSASSSQQSAQYHGYYNTAKSDDPYAAATVSSAMSSDATSAANDPVKGKEYQLLQSSPSYTGSGGGEYKTCSLTKNASLSSTVTPTNNTGSAAVSVDYFLLGRVTKVGSNYLVQYAQTGTTVTSPSWVTLYTFTPTQPNVNFTVSMTAGTASGCTSEGEILFFSLNTQSTLSTCSASGNQVVPLTHNSTFNETTSSISVTMTDTCGSIGSGCQLYKEKVDGVTTYENFQPVSNSHPPTVCKDISGFTHCESFWVREKTYLCQSGGSASYDLTNALERSKSVEESVSDSGSSFQYTDRTVDESGNVQTPSSTHNRTSSGLEMTGDCEMACKVSVTSEEVPAGQNQQGGMENVTQYQVSSDPLESVYYKQCIKDTAGSYSCPIAGSEVLVKDCACPDDFAEAASNMEMLQKASKDMICSSGVPQ